MDDRVAVLCTLAKHHLGDHDERGTAARSACRKVIRYKDPPLVPADVPLDSGAAETPEEADGTPFLVIGATYACDHCKTEGPAASENTWWHPDVGDRCGDSCQPLARGYVHAPASLPTLPEHNHFGESFLPVTCPVCAGMANENPPLRVRPIALILGGPSEPASLILADTGPASPPEPSTADLIRNIMSASETLSAAMGEAEEKAAEAERARAAADAAGKRHADAISVLAKHVGAGKLVLVGGATFKAVAPRKPRGGELAADALWRLEPVEVAK